MPLAAVDSELMDPANTALSPAFLDFQCAFRKQRIAFPYTDMDEHWRVEGLDMDKILKGDVVAGSAILLAGPPATHRFPLGLSFLSSGLTSDPDSDALLVSLREDEPAVVRIIGVYPQFRNMLHPDDPLRPNPRVRVLHFPPDYFTAERFLHWISREIKDIRREGRRVSRVLFSSLGQLLHNSPMFTQEPLFIDALLELFRKEEITSLFIGRADDRHMEIENSLTRFFLPL